jgi:hypothetical protein
MKFKIGDPVYLDNIDNPPLGADNPHEMRIVYIGSLGKIKAIESDRYIVEIMHIPTNFVISANESELQYAESRMLIDLGFARELER